MTKRLLFLVAAVLTFAGGGPIAHAQDIRALISDEHPSGHGQNVKQVFNQTASGYGFTTEVSVQDFSSPSELTDTAIEEEYDIILRARVPGDSAAIVAAAETAWQNGIPFVSPHGQNTPVRYEVTDTLLAEGPIFVGGEDLRPGLDGTFGGNLELDVLSLEGSALQSYASAAGTAILSWIHEAATSESQPEEARWHKARQLLRLIAARYDSIPTPSDLTESENELPEDVSTLATWQTYDGADVERTVNADGTIHIELSGGGSELKYYALVNQDFPAGSAFSEMTVTNQGEDPFEVSSGLFYRKTIAPGETRKVIIRHGFQAKQRDGIRYRVWGESGPQAFINAVFEPVIFDTQQPDLSPDYDAPRTDEHGAGLVLATRAGLLGTGQLGEAEQAYAQEQQDRLEEALEELPVELADFDGHADGHDAVLTWKTLTEENSAGFYVEQKTGEGAWRQASELIEGAGNSQTPQIYSHRVEDLSYGTHIFRLRQVDIDDSETVLDARARVEVRMGKAYTLHSVYPNPFRQQATVTFAVRKAQQVSVALYNTLGQRVQVLREGSVPASKTIRLALDAGSLASGAYFVRLRGEHFTATEPVTLTR